VSERWVLWFRRCEVRKACLRWSSPSARSFWTNPGQVLPRLKIFFSLEHTFLMSKGASRHGQSVAQSSRRKLTMLTMEPPKSRRTLQDLHRQRPVLASVGAVVKLLVTPTSCALFVAGWCGGGRVQVVHHGSTRYSVTRHKQDTPLLDDYAPLKGSAGQKGAPSGRGVGVPWKY
jgi:hypothetical protein